MLEIKKAQIIQVFGTKDGVNYEHPNFAELSCESMEQCYRFQDIALNALVACEEHIDLFESDDSRILCLQQWNVYKSAFLQDPANDLDVSSKWYSFLYDVYYNMTADLFAGEAEDRLESIFRQMKKSIADNVKGQGSFNAEHLYNLCLAGVPHEMINFTEWSIVPCTVKKISGAGKLFTNPGTVLSAIKHKLIYESNGFNYANKTVTKEKGENPAAIIRYSKQFLFISPHMMSRFTDNFISNQISGMQVNREDDHWIVDRDNYTFYTGTNSRLNMRAVYLLKYILKEDTLLPGEKYVNTCGNKMCINPDCWEKHTKF